MNSHGYEIFDEERSRGILVKGEWTSEIASVMKRERITHLRLSVLAGWKGNDLAFLIEVPWVKTLDIIATELSGLPTLYALKELHTLVLDGVAPKIEFPRMPGLRRIALGKWRGTNLESVFSCHHLESLSIGGFTGHDLRAFQALKRLQHLALGYSRLRSLRLSEDLPSLLRLSVTKSPHLQALEGIEHCPVLLVLWIEEAKALAEVSSLAQLTQLRTLILSGCPRVSSLRAIHGLPALETVGLMQSTNILDGDVEVIRSLPRLKNATFVDRRHYNARAEQFPKELPVFY